MPTWRFSSSSATSSVVTARSAPVHRSAAAVLTFWPLSNTTPISSDMSESDTPVPVPTAQLDPEIKISTKLSSNTLSLEIIEARHLYSQRSQACSSFVRIRFYPDCRRKPRTQTDIIPNNNFPHYDKLVSLHINPDKDADKRLLISVWNQLDKAGLSEFLGSVTISVDTLITKNLLNVWYKLDNEMVSSPQSERPPTDMSSSHNGSMVNSYLSNSTHHSVVTEVCILRSPGRGLGFTVSGSFPSHVSKVERRSPADLAGVCAGDYILKVDGASVAEANNEAVVRLLRQTSSQNVKLQLCRPKTIHKSTSYSEYPSLRKASSNKSQQVPVIASRPSVLQIKREVKSFHDIAGTIFPQSIKPQTQSKICLHFVYGSHKFVRPKEFLIETIHLTVVERNTLIRCRLFVFVDFLLFAHHSNVSAAALSSELISLLMDPIDTSSIRHVHQSKDVAYDFFIQYVNTFGRLCIIRLRCSSEKECKELCGKKIKQRFETVL